MDTIRQAFRRVGVVGTQRGTEGSRSVMLLLMYVCSNKLGISMQLSVTMATAEPLGGYIWRTATEGPIISF